MTSEAYDPSPVDRVEADLSPVGADPPPTMAQTETDPPSEGGGGEGGLGDVPLDPGEADESASAPTRPTDVDPGDVGSDDAGAEPGGTEPPESDAATPVSPVEPSTPVEPCPGREFEGSCYEVFADLVTWDVAEQRCVAWGGHLALVESPREDAFLDDWPDQLGITGIDGSGVWLGATDAALEGSFRWWDGTLVTVDGWGANQPDNGPGVDCIEKRNDGTGLWFDQRCVDPHRYVCERPL